MKNKILRDIPAVSMREKSTAPRMRIAVIGGGRVGLPTALGLAVLGHRVICCERDAEKRRVMASGYAPFSDEGISGALVSAVRSGALRFCADVAVAVEGADAAIVAVPVHERAGGQDELHKIASAVPSDCVLIVKSTVPPGTCGQLSELYNLCVAANPEFLRQGFGFKDFMSPSRIVAGSDDSRARQMLRVIYAPLIERERGVKYIETNCISAEIAKLACNMHLSSRITLANETADLCVAAGGNIDDVTSAVAADTRIGGDCLRAGAGFGGACLPKDGRLLIAAANRLGVDMRAAGAAYTSNHERMRRIVRSITDLLPDNPVVAVWGVAFKPDADSVCESPAVNIMRGLCEQGCHLQVYEPLVDRQTLKNEVSEARFFTTGMDALSGADALAVLNGNKAFSGYSPAEVLREMRGNLVFDYAGIFDRAKSQASGIILHTVGMPVKLEREIAFVPG